MKQKEERRDQPNADLRLARLVCVCVYVSLKYRFETGLSAGWMSLSGLPNEIAGPPLPPAVFDGSEASQHRQPGWCIDTATVIGLFFGVDAYSEVVGLVKDVVVMEVAMCSGA